MIHIFALCVAFAAMDNPSQNTGIPKSGSPGTSHGRKSCKSKKGHASIQGIDTEANFEEKQAEEEFESLKERKPAKRSGYKKKGRSLALAPTVDTESYEVQNQEWPIEGKVILAHHYDDRVVVYQAFNERIASWAVENQLFGGPDWSPDRMTWIKTNFLWMMFRCGWGQKDPNQKRILAITISRRAFEEFLSLSWPTQEWEAVGEGKLFSTKKEWSQAQPPKGSGVNLQWDPDHLPTGEKHSARQAIQLGLSREVATMIWNTPECILAIDDITDFVSALREVLRSTEFETNPKFKLPKETVWSPNKKLYKKTYLE